MKIYWFLLIVILLSIPAGMTWADETVSYSDHGLRDPFWPLVSSGGAIVSYDSNFSASELILEGIIADGKSRLAIINGNIVEVGKRIGFYTIQAILQDRVILVKDGQSIELRLKKEE